MFSFLSSNNASNPEADNAMRQACEAHLHQRMERILRQQEGYVPPEPPKPAAAAVASNLSIILPTVRLKKVSLEKLAHRHAA